jgi:hypothetical protein
MSEHDKELVSLNRFVELMNDELRRQSGYRDGMKFVNIGTGYDFVDLNDTLTITEEKALDKSVFDQVRSRYTIAR